MPELLCQDTLINKYSAMNKCQITKERPDSLLPDRSLTTIFINNPKLTRRHEAQRNAFAVATGPANIRLRLFAKILCQVHSEWTTTETSFITIVMDQRKGTRWIRFFETFEIVFISEIPGLA